MVMEHTGTELQTTGSQSIQVEDARLTPQSIASTKEQMALADQLVLEVMKFGIDFGVTPGTKSPGLWDAGAAKIVRTFKCHFEHKVLFREESEDLVSITIEALLIHNESKQVVGSGLGAASTRESKYKYRWVSKADALREGYTEDDLANLKTKAGWNNEVMYRIDNPEYGELVHTVLVMAAKRAEIDAAKSLPGVAAALKVKFDGKPAATDNAGPAGQEDLTLPIFWAMAKGAGLSEDDVHRMLGVASMKIWKESGKTYREAIIQLMKVAVTAARATKKPKDVKKTPDAGGDDVKPTDITESMVKTVDTLVALCNSFWGMTEQQIFKELGYASRENFVDARVDSLWNAWLTILAVKQPAP